MVIQLGKPISPQLRELWKKGVSNKSLREFAEQKGYSYGTLLKDVYDRDKVVVETSIQRVIDLTRWAISNIDMETSKNAKLIETVEKAIYDSETVSV
jgi:lambda repressor-like predicted transcriptional regulator